MNLLCGVGAKPTVHLHVGWEPMPPMQSDSRDYKLDISSIAASDRASKPRESRPYLSVMFKCCSVYQRIYRNNDGTSYEGRCPKCMRPVRFVVGQGGSNDRFFVVE